MAGNVTLPSFIVALMTWFFNRMQGWRGGVPFPSVINSGELRTPVAAESVATGDRVCVLGSDAIGKTLDRTNRNRGMWFDREMIKHCHQQYTVELRVDRIVDDVTGRMLQMKTPCIVLKDVVASGEFLRFCAQQEFIFWREVWLKKVSVQPHSDPVMTPPTSLRAQPIDENE
jgi:hypothetical protein